MHARRGALRHGLSTGALGTVVALSLVGCGPDATRRDTGPAQDRREHTIERLRAGDLAVEGPGYTVLSDKPLAVFFQTWTGMGPDPYCGYEYADVPAVMQRDPLGSGGAEVEAIGDGWYWICAR